MNYLLKIKRNNAIAEKIQAFMDFKKSFSKLTLFINFNLNKIFYININISYKIRFRSLQDQDKNIKTLIIIKSYDSILNLLVTRLM